MSAGVWIGVGLLGGLGAVARVLLGAAVDARDAVRVVGDRRPREHAEGEGAGQVHRERAPREAAPDAPGDGAVEQEPADGAQAPDESDRDDDERAQRARTTLVTMVTAAKPATMLAAA